MQGQPQAIRVFGIADDSVVDGPGIRLAVFTQGCAKHCPGCHNPDSWDYDGGYLAGIDELMDKVKANPLLQGVTLSGGEPFDQAAALLPLVARLRDEGPRLDLWAYSGYLFEELAFGRPSADASLLLAATDVLVDGPYIQAQRSLGLRWRGSANQRVIDVPASLAAGEAVLAFVGQEI